MKKVVISQLLQLCANADFSMDRSLRYLIRYFILLVAYGGTTEYGMPKRKKVLDKSRLNLYQFHYKKALDGQSVTGVIVDENGEVVAEV